MALLHTIIEIRSYYDAWLAIVDIEDDTAGQFYHFRWSFTAVVTEASQILLDKITSAKENIQAELLLLANKMNLPKDEQKAMEYFSNVKQAIILEIRNNPSATLVQAQTYIDTEYPDSMINFTKLYQWYLGLLDLSTWDEFKTYVINSKFRGID